VDQPDSGTSRKALVRPYVLTFLSLIYCFEREFKVLIRLITKIKILPILLGEIHVGRLSFLLAAGCKLNHEKNRWEKPFSQCCKNCFDNRNGFCTAGKINVMKKSAKVLR
jgi:hypothetical protein